MNLQYTANIPIKLPVAVDIALKLSKVVSCSSSQFFKIGVKDFIITLEENFFANKIFQAKNIKWILKEENISIIRVLL